MVSYQLYFLTFHSKYQFQQPSKYFQLYLVYCYLQNINVVYVSGELVACGMFVVDHTPFFPILPPRYSSDRLFKRRQTGSQGISNIIFIFVLYWMCVLACNIQFIGSKDDQHQNPTTLRVLHSAFL